MMGSYYNRIRIRLKPNGSVELKMQRRSARGIQERIVFSVPRRTLERALAEATIEAPWKELLRR